MAIVFPAALDSFTNPTATDARDSVTVPHALQHANINDAVEALEAKVGIDNSADTNSLDYLIRNLLPSGVIVMWSGTIANIPSGWVLCDGNNGTPDLRDKFVVGATQDAGGVAKSNIEGSLKQTGGVTGHSHSAHAALSHSGLTIGDHTGLTHGLTIANHPDLTHAALVIPALTVTQPDHSLATFSGSHASNAAVSVPSYAVVSAAASRPTLQVPSNAAVSVPSQAIASGVDISAPTASFASNAAISVPSQGMSVASTAGVASFATSTNRSGLTAFPAHTVTFASIANASGPSGSIAAFTASRPSLAVASVANASHPTVQIASGTDISVPSQALASIANASNPSGSHTHASSAVSHPDISLASRTMPGVGTHVGTDYGVHTFTAPAAHGTAGTVTHSFSEPDAHTISAHDTVSNVPTYYSLAYIMKV